MAFKVFHRTFWKSVNGRRVPHLGRRTILAWRVESEAEAQAICRRFNDSHPEGFYSRKAEYVRRS